MTEQTRRNLLRYGIAIDLVILATGIAMILPPTLPLLVGVYGVATALSVVRGGWKGAATALALSLVALVVVFPEMATPSLLALTAGAGILEAAAISFAMRRPEPETAMAAPAFEAEPESESMAVAIAEEPVAEEPAVQEPAMVAEPQVSQLAKVLPLESPQPFNKKHKKGKKHQQFGATQLQPAEIARFTQDDEAERLRLEDERRQQSEAEAARIAAEAEAERLRLEEERRHAEAEAARIAAEAEAERLRLEEERRAAEAEAARIAAEAEAERARLEEERRTAEEAAARIATEAEAERARLEEERRAAEAEAARIAAEAAQRELSAKLEAERQRADDERRRAEAEKLRADSERQELAERMAREREEAEREMRERLDAERRAAEEDLRRQLETEREAMRLRAEQELAEERARLERESNERVAAAEASAAAARALIPPAGSPPAPKTSIAREEKPSLLGAITGWFRREPRPRTVNLNTKRVNGNSTATKRPPAASTSPARRTSASQPKPRILMIERRRATADTVAPKLRHRSIEVQIVERWVDAVDEIFRFKPNALFLDIEHPEFDRIHKTVTDKTSTLPLILTGRAHATVPSVQHAAFVARPYDLEEVARLANKAQASPDDLLASQAISSTRPLVQPAKVVAPPKPLAPRPAPVAPPPPPPEDEDSIALYDGERQAEVIPMPSLRAASNEQYDVICFTCRVGFNAVEADWCSCLAKERSLVCTNCLSCFCKAPPAYKEKFWVEAPPRLFERKTSEARRQESSLPANLPKEQVRRPLVLTVEDDEEIQAIVQRVCTNLGYGFVWANNGQDGLELAREYKPNMILSDAFMPKLDGREMCRILKEEPEHADTRMVVMTGLYTDTKYRSEAVKRFHVDDYIAKPVAITELINLLQKHLEGVTGLPAQEDLYSLHRQELDVEEAEIPLSDDDVPLSDILDEPAGLEPMTTMPELVPRPARSRGDVYDVCCFNCQEQFDATRAEWCRCVGRDNTLLCEHCGGCFCKAPAAYRERFWIDAPPSLFERKMIGSKRNLSARANPAPAEVKRPLILLVEDDENVQLIVRTVVSSMGYGFVVGANGQEGLSLAREYNPDLILSDAFMPKLDGREMCRLLKEDPNTSRSKAIIMTGLYTDRKYRNEALDYFKVDDYVAKPLAVDDLIKLFKKHLPQEVATAH